MTREERATSNESPAFEPGSLVTSHLDETVHRVTECGEDFLAFACMDLLSRDSFPAHLCSAYSEDSLADVDFCGCVGSEAHELTDEADRAA